MSPVTRSDLHGCSLAWGGKLSSASEPSLATGVLDGTDTGLTDQEKALASWARKIVEDLQAALLEFAAVADALDAGE